MASVRDSGSLLIISVLNHVTGKVKETSVFPFCFARPCPDLDLRGQLSLIFPAMALSEQRAEVEGLSQV